MSGPLPSTKLGRIWGSIRGVAEPLFLVFHGASRMSGSVATAVCLFILVPLMAWLLESAGFISQEQAQNYTHAFWILLAIVITFSKPSRYALTGYGPKDVSRVLDRMPELHSCGREVLPALHSCLHRAEEDTKARLTTIKWVAGSIFALALILGQKGFDQKDGNLLGYALLPLVLALLIAGFIAIHARATVAVYGLAQAVIHSLEVQSASRQRNQKIRLARGRHNDVTGGS